MSGHEQSEPAVEGCDCQRCAIEYRNRYRAELAAMRERQQWIPVTERLPDAGVNVLALYSNELGKTRRVRAFHAPRLTMEYDSANGDFEADYDEERDAYYWPEGWYESIENWDEFSAVVIHGQVVAWMPLPPISAQDECGHPVEVVNESAPSAEIENN